MKRKSEKEIIEKDERERGERKRREKVIVNMDEREEREKKMDG